MTRLLEATDVALATRLAPVGLTSTGGEMIALVGRNGSGKTSLLRALARVEGARGTVRVEGEDLDRAGEARRRRLLAFLPASREIAWPIAIRDIIALGRRLDDPDRVHRLLETFDLTDLADQSIGNVSTGERARALLARAFAARPRLVLLDEPLSNLDPYWVLRTLDILADAAREGATVMAALHDLSLVERFDRLLLLDGGRIVADGTPARLSERLGTLFGVEPAPGGGWRISPSADRRSSR